MARRASVEERRWRRASVGCGRSCEVSEDCAGGFVRDIVRCVVRGEKPKLVSHRRSRNHSFCEFQTGRMRSFQLHAIDN